jgi:hypothetical protein
MPIFTYDPNIDRYPVAEQSAQIALNKQQLDQGQQRIDLAAKGQEADIGIAQERLKLFQEEAGLRRQEFDQRRAQLEDMARVGLLGLQRDVQATPEADDDAEFAAIEQAAAGIKSPEARAAYFQDVRGEMQEKRLGKAFSALTDSIGESVRQWAQGPFPELNEAVTQRVDLMMKELEAFQAPGMPPEVRAQAIDNARQMVGRLQDQYIKESERQYKEKSDQEYALSVQGMMPANSPGGALVARAIAEAQGGRGSWLAAARAISQIQIGNTVKVNVRDPDTGESMELWLSPEEAADRALKLEQMRGRNPQASELNAAAEAAMKVLGDPPNLRDYTNELTGEVDRASFNRDMKEYNKPKLSILRQMVSPETRQVLGFTSTDGTLAGLGEQHREEAIERINAAIESRDAQALIGAFEEFGISKPPSNEELGREIKPEKMRKGLRLGERAPAAQERQPSMAPNQRNLNIPIAP